MQFIRRGGGGRAREREEENLVHLVKTEMKNGILLWKLT